MITTLIEAARAALAHGDGDVHTVAAAVLDEDGFPDAGAVLPGLRGYYPELGTDDEIVIVRFRLDGE
ncbi:hypothetical protein ACFY36_11555 [Actinoplanes sp. NPDC000266]